MLPLIIGGLVATVGVLALASSPKKKAANLAGAIGKGALNLTPTPPKVANLGRNARGAILGGAVAEDPNAPAARAALAKYGQPQYFQRTFADYNQPGGWTDVLDDTVPAQKPAIARARMLVPKMLGLTLDIAQDLGDAGDGRVAQEAQAIGEGVVAAADIYEGNFVGGAVEAYQAVSDWMGANVAEWERINNEKIAIDVAKQILLGIAQGHG